MSKPPQRRARGRGIIKAEGAQSLEGVVVNQEIATTHDGRDITRPWVHELEEFRDVRLQGALDWGVYDRILLDDQVKSCFEQRRSAVVSREWNVLSGDDSDPRANAAAEALEANLKEVGFDNVTDKMLYATFHGISVAELGWGAWRGMIGWVRNGRARPIHVRHARRFRYDSEGRLRLITRGNMMGEVLPERKFWVVRTGASNDDEPYGRGLAEWLYWPTLFKRNGIRFWNIFLDKFSVPPVKGVYPRGTSEPEIQKLLAAMMALANDSGIAVPEGVVLDFMQVATNGIDFEKMPAFMDAAIAKIILSQTMTTEDGSSRAQGQVHAGVKQELIIADADLLTDSFTEGPARWFTDINFGTDVAAPIVTRQVEEEEDTKTAAETDAALDAIGYRRTEESFQDVYGDGYERKPEPLPVDPEAEPAATSGDRPRLRAVSFSEGGAGDIVDQAVGEIMADEGWRQVADELGVNELIAELTAASRPEAVAAILAREAEMGDMGPLIDRLERAGFAVRMAGAAGADR
jgi:phage gp29-like protein